MIRGKIIGQVWGARQVPGLEGRKLVLVAAQDAAQAPTGRLVVAIDTLGLRSGEDVTVAFGSGARNVVQRGPDNRALLCDAAVAMIVDGSG